MCGAIASAAAAHHPEFTMLEWYRAGEPYDAVMDDCVALIRLAAETAGAEAAASSRRGGAIRSRSAERISVAEAFRATPASTCWHD